MGEDCIAGCLGAGGLLAGTVSGFGPRAGQLVMARAVDETLANGGALLVEGPTGVGKSLAYLVPATRRATSGERVLIVTAGLGLQAQLVDRDLPALARAVPWRFAVGLAKGRGNYICRVRARLEGDAGRLRWLGDPHADERAALLDWARATSTGDRAELPFVPVAGVWASVGSDRRSCRGLRCIERGACFVERARAATKRAALVVANAHLLATHLRYGRGLPDFDACIVDEAHRVPDIVRDALSARVSAGSIRRAARPLAEYEPGLRAALLDEGERFFCGLGKHSRAPAYSARLRRPDVVSPRALCNLLARAGDIFRKHDARLAASSSFADRGRAADLGRAGERCDELRAVLARAMALSEPGEVVSVELADGDEPGRAVLVSQPLHVDDFLREHLFGATRAVIATSATLTAAGSFEHVAGELGATGARTLAVESPFDHARQALLVTPAAPLLPDPSAAPGAYRAAVADALARVVPLARGRGVLALFTSRVGLEVAAARLRACGRRVLVQGEAPTDALVEAFRADGAAVLLGLASLWEGVDVPGDALSVVVVDRLPFRPPDAVSDALDELEGRSRAFERHALPRACVALRQAAGRLIRRETDRGVVILLDPRLATARYRAAFIDSLPPMPRALTLDAVGWFFSGEERARGAA